LGPRDVNRNVNTFAGVDSMTSKGPGPDIHLVVVYQTSNPALSAVAKSILDGGAIEYMVRPSNMASDPTDSSWFGADFGTDEFLVSEADAEWVRELLADLKPSSGTSKED